MHGSFIPYSVLLIFHALNFASINFCDYKKNSSKSVLNFTILSMFLFYFKNPELRARVTKNKEILKRYKCLVQSSYREPANGNLDDCTKEVLAELPTEENSESEEECKSKTRPERCFKFHAQIVTVLIQNKRECS